MLWQFQFFFLLKLQVWKLTSHYIQLFKQLTMCFWEQIGIFHMFHYAKFYPPPYWRYMETLDLPTSSHTLGWWHETGSHQTQWSWEHRNTQTPYTATWMVDSLSALSFAKSPCLLRCRRPSQHQWMRCICQSFEMPSAYRPNRSIDSFV